MPMKIPTGVRALLKLVALLASLVATLRSSDPRPKPTSADSELNSLPQLRQSAALPFRICPHRVQNNS